MEARIADMASAVKRRAKRADIVLVRLSREVVKVCGCMVLFRKINVISALYIGKHQYVFYISALYEGRGCRREKRGEGNCRVGKRKSPRRDRGLERILLSYGWGLLV